MNHSWSHTYVCPHCRKVDCDCPSALFGLTLGLPVLAAHYGYGLLAEAVDMVKQVTWACGCGPLCHCDCTCPCHDQKRRAGHPWKEKLHATTDIQLESRLGETRVVPFLVENNRPNDVTITFRARPWIDAHGQGLSDETVEFDPKEASLKSGESVGVKAIIKVSEPLEAGMTYFSEFNLDGCPAAKPISVGLRVQATGQYVHYALCDPCRHRAGHFAEFCDEPWCECGGKGHWDPHRHWRSHHHWDLYRPWYDKSLCRWGYLPQFA